MSRYWRFNGNAAIDFQWAAEPGGREQVEKKEKERRFSRTWRDAELEVCHTRLIIPVKQDLSLPIPHYLQPFSRGRCLNTPTTPMFPALGRNHFPTIEVQSETRRPTKGPTVGASGSFASPGEALNPLLIVFCIGRVSNYRLRGDWILWKRRTLAPPLSRDSMTY